MNIAKITVEKLGMNFILFILYFLVCLDGIANIIHIIYDLEKHIFNFGQKSRLPPAVSFYNILIKIILYIIRILISIQPVKYIQIKLIISTTKTTRIIM